MSYRKLRGDFSKATVVRFTAAADVADGAVVTANGRIGVAHNNTKNGEEGLFVVGTDENGILMPKSTGAITRHTRVYWAAAGNPIGGTAGSGAITSTASGNTLLGRAVKDAASGDAEVIVELTNE
jgi:predicted RecA/RadA family phage recombinase